METKPKVRLGNGKKRSASWLTAAICLSDAEGHAYTYNGKKYVNLNINIYDQPNEYGKDVAITLNDYKKEENSNPQVNKILACYENIDSKGNLIEEENYNLPF
jgi:cell shape-determining protein MreC